MNFSIPGPGPIHPPTQHPAAHPDTHTPSGEEDKGGEKVDRGEIREEEERGGHCDSNVFDKTLGNSLLTAGHYRNATIQHCTSLHHTISPHTAPHCTIHRPHHTALHHTYQHLNHLKIWPGTIQVSRSR